MSGDSQPTLAELLQVVLARFDATNQAVAELRSEFRSELKTVRQDISALRGEVSTLREDLSTLWDDLSTLRDEVASLARVTLARFEAGERALLDLRVAVMARLDRVENTMTSVHDDLVVNLARTNRAHDAIEHTREELRAVNQEVTMMWRRIRRLETEVREIRGDP